MHRPDHKDVDQLQADGWGFLNAEEFCQAAEVGDQLIALRHSSGFEILAAAQFATGERTQAIATLEAGVENAPEVYRLWNMLGSMLSTEGRFEEALSAYDRAKSCPVADIESIDYNRAVLFDKMGRYEEALQILESCRIDAGSMTLAIESLRMGILNRLGRHADVLAAISAIEELQDSPQDNRNDNPELPYYIDDSGYKTAYGNHEFIAAVWVQVVEAGNALGHDAKELLGSAFKAIRQDAHNEDAQWWIRQLRNLRSPNSALYNLLVEGSIWDELQKAPRGFYRSYRVLAETPEEALEFAQEFEAERITLHEAKLDGNQDNAPDLPKGVYDVSPMHMWERKGTFSKLRDSFGVLFEVSDEPRTTWEIIKWWEWRRLAYNLIVFVAGIVSLFWFLITLTFMVGRYGDIGDPFLGIFLIPVLAILANICYTGGWLLELYMRNEKNAIPGFGPKLLKLGIVISIVVVSAPAVFGSLLFLANLLGIVSFPVEP